MTQFESATNAAINKAIEAAGYADAARAAIDVGDVTRASACAARAEAAAQAAVVAYERALTCAPDAELARRAARRAEASAESVDHLL